MFFCPLSVMDLTTAKPLLELPLRLKISNERCESCPVWLILLLHFSACIQLMPLHGWPLGDVMRRNGISVISRARAPTRPVCKLSFRDDATGFADSHFPLPEGPLLPLKSDEASTFGDA